MNKEVVGTRRSSLYQLVHAIKLNNNYDNVRSHFTPYPVQPEKQSFSSSSARPEKNKKFLIDLACRKILNQASCSSKYFLSARANMV